MKYLLLLFCLGGINLYSQDNIFDPKTSDKELFHYAELVKKSNTGLSLEDIPLIPDFFDESIQLESDNHSVGFTTDDYWIRFKLKNRSTEFERYYLETGRPVTDTAEMLLVQNGSQKYFQSGDQIPFNERQVLHRATVFKLELPPHSISTVYIHLKSDGETINVPLNLYSETDFWLMNYKQQLFLGLFYGLLLLAGIIYLFFYDSLRTKAFLYYGLYVFSIALLQAALDGLIFQYVLPNGGYLNSRAVLITALLSNFFLLKYCEHFLNFKEPFGQLHKLYRIIYGLLAVLGVMIFINEKTLEWTYPIANINGLFSLLMILFTIFALKQRRRSIDPYFSLGILFLVIGLSGFVMNNLSLLPNNFYTLNSAKFGAGLEVIFLSLSMTNLIKKLRLEKEHSQKEALTRLEEISQLKSYFMSNISHELRTPINAIMGIANEELKHTKKNGKGQSFEMIRNASLSLLSHVNDILDFEKIENNELELNMEIFNPCSVIEQIYQNWKIQAENKGLGFKYSIGSDMPDSVKSDPERFAQILNHLLSNAVKFTQKGHIDLKVTGTREAEGIYRLTVEVTDTGVGMGPEVKKVAFSSFNQMRLDHKRKTSGIGLGLTIVKELTNLFGGDVILNSERDKGTSISVQIPMQANFTSNQSRTTNLDSTLGNLSNILIVEDNKMNQLVLKKALGSLKHLNITVANNGKEGLEALRKKPFNMVLMDLQMPVMDGYEAIATIRSGKLGIHLTDIPIVAITADATLETKKRVLNMGVEQVVTKPVKSEVLLRNMCACLDGLSLKIA